MSFVSGMVCLSCTSPATRYPILWLKVIWRSGGREMNRFAYACAGAVALAGLVGPADAADLSRPVYTKAPPLAAPYYNWTGFYIGINGGGGWGSSNWASLRAFHPVGGARGGHTRDNSRSSAQ